MACYLTADGGTESLRARIYDLSGTCLGQKAVPYETKFSPGARAEQIQQQAMAEGLRTLRQDGLEKVLAGVTTIEEVRATSNG